MGVVKEIGIDTFPEQYTENIGQEVNIYFNYDTSKTIKGKYIRDDKGEPYRTIFQLEDGRVVLATECQYQPIFKKK